MTDSESSSSEKLKLCELCSDYQINGHCETCEHQLCNNCYRYCDICGEKVCIVCDKDCREELICNKCSIENCVHGFLVGYNYRCEKKGCDGKMKIKK
jgi:hypothetical protein